MPISLAPLPASSVERRAMGDPFSAAGTAVGITSLGIQTCQIIHKYYSDFKGYHDDIDNVVRQAEVLQGILENLHQLKDRHEVDDAASSSQLRLALQAYEDALHALKRMADKCAVAKQAHGVQARLREVRKRVLWPYRKETIAGLQATLDAFQKNLNLAVHSAGWDSMLRNFDYINPTLTAIHGQTKVMKQDLVTQTGTLTALRADVADAALVRRQHHKELSSTVSELLLQSSQQHAAVEQKLDLMMSSITSYGNAATVAPSLLAEYIQLSNNVQSQTSMVLTNQQQRTLPATFSRPHSPCNCRPKSKQSLQYGRWISYLSEEEYQHRSTCPHSVKADHCQTFAAQMIICNGLLRFCVQAGLKRSKSGGWNAVAPILRYRAVVPRGTGAFKILRDAELAIRLSSAYSRQQISDILTTATTDLQGVFQTSASPYDLEESGSCLLDVALDLLNLASGYGMASSRVIKGLLDVCNIPNSPRTPCGLSSFTPMERWQWTMIIKPVVFQTSSTQHAYTEVLYYLARTTGNWSIIRPPLPVVKHNTQDFYDLFSGMIGLENMTYYFDEDDPLLLAMLQRSELDLERCTLQLDSSLLKSSLTTCGYATALITWPKGLKILCSHGLLDDDSDNLVDVLWDYALHIPSIECVQVLVHYKKYKCSEDWFKLNALWKKTLYHMPRSDIHGETMPFAKKRKSATMFDTLLAKDQNQVSRCFSDCNNGNFEPYHCSTLSILGAQAAWRHGYRDVSSVSWVDNSMEEESEFGTPLWHFSRWTLYLTNDLRRYSYSVSLIEWFMRHGADPFWVHPKFFTTPALNIVRGASYRAIDTASVIPLSDSETLLTSQAYDGCTCACSKNGCCCISCLASWCGVQFSGTWIYRFENDDFNKLAKNWRRITFPYVFNVVNQHKDKLWMSTAVLRMMTFEALSLTHTCCYRSYEELHDEFQRPTAEERDVIQDYERDDIELLNTLVAEFKAKWATYDKPFVTFMNRVWKRKMKQVKDDRRGDQETYKAELLRMGVTLEQPEPDNEESEESEESESDWPDDYESEDGREGWYTTDEELEEDEEEVEDENEDL